LGKVVLLVRVIHEVEELFAVPPMPDQLVPPPRLGVPADEHPHYAWWRHDRGIAEATPAEIERARTAYFGLVSALDDMIGRVLAALEASGLADNTVVIYTSDHGEHLGERGLWWKSTLYDESAKVPLIVSWPGRIAPGERRDAVCSLLDVNATMLDIAGAPPLPGSQGRSLKPVLLDKHAPWIDETTSEYVNDGVPAWSGGRMVVSRMVRSGRYKLIWHRGHREQLFDLVDDPDEQHDLAQVLAHASVRDSLRARLLADWDPEAIARTVDQHVAEQALMARWTRAVAPPEVLRWQMHEGDNWLGRTPPPGGRP